jgi:hypothetical protein
MAAPLGHPVEQGDLQRMHQVLGVVRDVALAAQPSLASVTRARHAND